MYALILAGGKGERLRPLTNSLPKPMVRLLDRPILWYQVQWLRYYGVTDIVFLGGYHWEAIHDYFGDGKGLGVRIQYSIEETPLGRGGAIRKGMALVPPSERFVIATNGDVVTAEDIGAMIEMHKKGAFLATIMLVPLVSPYGIVDVGDGGRVTGFREKAVLPFWINGGVYILDRELEAELPTLGDHELSTFPRLASLGRLGGYLSRTYWKSVDNFKDLREAEEALGRLVEEREFWRAARG
jgi:NDP-sugar pyrophosphorylase family protein